MVVMYVEHSVLTLYILNTLQAHAEGYTRQTSEPRMNESVWHGNSIKTWFQDANKNQMVL